MWTTDICLLTPFIGSISLCWNWLQLACIGRKLKIIWLDWRMGGICEQNQFQLCALKDSTEWGLLKCLWGKWKQLLQYPLMCTASVLQLLIHILCLLSKSKVHMPKYPGNWCIFTCYVYLLTLTLSNIDHGYLVMVSSGSFWKTIWLCVHSQVHWELPQVVLWGPNVF